MARMKEFLMSLAATTVSIILTFGTTAIIDRSNYQSKVMMKVTDDQLEVFSKEHQKLMEVTKKGGADEQKAHLDELKQRNQAFIKARQEGKNKTDSMK